MGFIERFLGKLQAPLPSPRVGRFLGNSQAPLPSQGIGDFVNQLQGGINDHLATQIQLELERRNIQTANEAIRIEEAKKMAQRQREQETQARLEKAEALTEAMKVLKDYQVEAKLKHIQEAVWRGRGKIRLVEPELEIAHGERKGSDRLGGLQLIHEYPFFTRIVWQEGDGDAFWNEWKYEPRTISSGLSVVVFRQKESDANGKMLKIHSEAEIHDTEYEETLRSIHSRDKDASFYTKVLTIINLDIPVGTSESKGLLDSALTQESVDRTARNLLPTRLEQEAGRRLAIAKRSPSWMKATRDDFGVTR